MNAASRIRIAIAELSARPPAVRTAVFPALFAALLVPLPQAHAQDDVHVYSSTTDAVSVTVYRDNIALITETRSVDLPASAMTLVIDGVADTLLPQSAVLADLDRTLIETNFDADELTPQSLLERHIGREVTLTRTDPGSGRVTRTTATVIAAGHDVVLALDGGYEALHCAGLPERLEFHEVPEGLRGRPQLSVRLAPGDAGRRTFKVSYLAHGFSWSADYVARLNERSDRMALSGWATLSNDTGWSFNDIDLQLVAGALNILDADAGGSREAPPPRAADVAPLRECHSLPYDSSDEPGVDGVEGRMMFVGASGIGDAREIVVTGARIVRREELGDYYLYRLPWQTDLPARQTKQVLFLDKPDVRIERFYGFRMNGLNAIRREGVVVPNVMIAWDNTEDSGPGEPLARGTMRFFERHDPAGAEGRGPRNQELFAGEAWIADTPVGVPVELEIGRALNLTLEITTMFENTAEGANRERRSTSNEYRIVNNKTVAVDMEIRHFIESRFVDARLDSTSHPMQRKLGDYAWRFPAQPGEQELRYQLSAVEQR